jgi:MFS family permease
VNVTGAGLFMLPSAAIMLVAGPLAGSLAGRVGAKVPLVIGTACATVSFALLAVAHSHEWQIVAAVTILGLGIGMSFASMANLIVEAVDQRETGVATGMNTIMRTIGGSLGGQIAATILAAHVSGGYPRSSAFTLAFGLSAVIVLLAFFMALLIPGRAAGAPAGEPVFAHR